MLKSLLFAALLAAPSFGAAPVAESPDSQFEALASKYIEEFLQSHPQDATELGDHRFDAELNDYSLEGVAKDAKAARDYLASLKAIKPKKLGADNQLDYAIFKDNLESTLLELETIRAHEWNPTLYNGANPIYPLISREHAPLRARLLSIKARLAKIPHIVASAKANLKEAPRIHTEVAIQQNKGSIGLIKNELNQFLAQVPELKAEFAPVQAAAVAALEDFGQWLEKDLLPRATRDFRLGDANFRSRLRYTLGSSLTKEQILSNAKAELKKTQEDMFQTALPLYRKFFPTRPAAFIEDPDLKKKICKAVLDKLAETHPTDETIVALAKESVDRCTRFVRENHLVTIPDDPLKIIVMPEFQRGVSVAYCDAPGALAKNEATFYAIAPAPADWTKERRESLYREYNNYMLENLTVHEAMPGHYLQLALANRAKAPTQVRTVFRSGIFAEGWATYTEQLMAAHGYGGPEVKMQQLKMRLRLVINSILDQKIHTAGMTEKEAMDLMMNEGFQEEGEAAGKWRRACLTSTQLSTYFVGNIEVNDLVKSYREARQGKADEQAVHDTILSYGSVSPKFLKQFLQKLPK